MTHMEKIAALNAECWARAKTALYLELGREATATEVGLYVAQSQLYTLLMMVFPDPEDRIAWFEGSLQVIAQGRPAEMAS